MNKLNLPVHIQQNLAAHRGFYSLDSADNILRCKRDPDYLGEVILVHESLIWHSVHKYVGRLDLIVRKYCVEKDDILQLGRMGFMKAMRAFDVEKGYKFSTFAVITITREIKSYLRDSAMLIRPTRTANELLRKMIKIESEFGYLPGVGELAHLLDADEKSIVKALQVVKPVKYLEEGLSSDSAGSRRSPAPYSALPCIADDTQVEESVVSKLYAQSVIQQMEDKLTAQEWAVLKLRTSGLNQAQTAERENLSQMRVSRIMKKIANLVRENECFQ